MELSDTQLLVLAAAAEHPQCRVERFPDHVKGGARSRVLAGLVARGLIVEDGACPVLTDAGFFAIGRERPIPAAEAARPRWTRDNTKQAAMIALLRRPEGATLQQLMAATGWQSHSVRAALTLMGRNLGLALTSQKAEGVRVYRAE